MVMFQSILSNFSLEFFLSSEAKATGGGEASLTCCSWCTRNMDQFLWLCADEKF